MAHLSRKDIEKKIRELALQLNKDLLAQQQARQLPQKVNLVVLRKMLDEWSNLAEYYEHNIYEKNFESDVDTDLEMSLFMVNNYLNWTRDLQIFISGAENHAETDKLEDALDYLEHSMQKILAAISDKDEFKL
jgi:hypothetical protein